MRLVSVTKSPNPAKKLRATFEDHGGRQKHTDFGDSSMDDYTQHHDTIRRANYRSRHQKDLLTNDPTRAGYLSYYILWGNSTSRDANIASYKKRFNL